MTRLVLFAMFVGTVIAANWALNRYGVVAVPLSGLEAPAGFYAAGLAFGLRDALHEVGGRRWVLAAIGTGAAVSYLIEDAVTIPGGLAPIAVASAAAFALSELADLAVYEPLRERADKLKVERTYHGVYGIAAAQGMTVDAPGAVTERRTPYTDHKWWIGAVALSNVVGAVVDSALFLWLAFGGLDHLAGNVWGKALMIAVAIPIVWGVRRAVPRDRLRTEGA